MPHYVRNGRGLEALRTSVGAILGRFVGVVGSGSADIIFGRSVGRSDSANIIFGGFVERVIFWKEGRRIIVWTVCWKAGVGETIFGRFVAGVGSGSRDIILGRFVGRSGSADTIFG